MNKFETTLLIKPDIEKNTLDSTISDFKQNITDLGGKIIATEDWGLRDLSYKIKKHSKAFYLFFQIEFNGSNMDKINKYLNLQESIIRYLFISVTEHEKLPTVVLKVAEKYER